MAITCYQLFESLFKKTNVANDCNIILLKVFITVCDELCTLNCEYDKYKPKDLLSLNIH